MNVSAQKLKRIQLLLLDVDGVLTDGGIIYSDAGSETKVFNVKDGLGLKLVMDAGIQVGLVTGRRSEALQHRCRDLGIRYLFDGVRQKDQLLEKILAQIGAVADSTAFVGDDLPDLGLMRLVGLAIAVADAHDLVRKNADWITSSAGGRGAVREVCDALLVARGIWQETIERF